MQSMSPFLPGLTSPRMKFSTSSLSRRGVLISTSSKMSNSSLLPPGRD